ncbi:hypothetical protein ACLI4Y_19865, partial [Natrialbaceae archaeon A-CW3]
QRLRCLAAEREFTDKPRPLRSGLLTVAAHMDALEVDHILTYDRHYDAFDVTTLPYRSQD